MPYRLQWLIENEVMLSQYWDETTEAELRESLLKGLTLAGTSDYPLLHTITDVTHVTKSVPLMKSVQIIKEVGKGMDQIHGWSIVVGQKDPVMKFATNITRQFFKMRQATFDTFAEAIDFLKDMDPDLNWDAADPEFMSGQYDQKES